MDMIRVPRTAGFGAILLTVSVTVRLWCKLVALRLRAEHPGAVGPVIAHFYWDFSWVGIPIAGILALMLIFFHFKKWENCYEAIYYLGLWLVVLWFSGALIGMEVAFVPWYDLRGAHY